VDLIISCTRLPPILAIDIYSTPLNLPGFDKSIAAFNISSLLYYRLWHAEIQ
jgi:hypothetical protein